MQFSKINGTGNDFIIINNIEEKLPVENFPSLAKKLCTRRMSIGADGLMVVEKSDVADFKMLFFNSDGSVGEMCGNGARCICRYGYEKKLAGELQTVETGSGLITGERLDERRYKIRMTKPTLVDLARQAEYAGESLSCSYIELGVPGLPHAVVNIPNLRGYNSAKLFDLGQQLRHSAAFPKGANVNFYDFTGENTIFERTFERGVEDFTFACGSGTCAVALSLYLKGKLSGARMNADMAGGRLEVEIEDKSGDLTLFLIGNTNLVAEGVVLDEEL